MKMKYIFVINVLFISILTGCNSLPPTRRLIKPPKYAQIANEESDDIKLVAKSFLPEGTKFLYPIHPNGADAVQFADIEGDGQDEILMAYKGYELGSASGVIVLKKVNNEWKEIWHDKNEVNVLGLDWAQFIDITEDEVPELLMGWNLGFEIGYNLDIVSFKNVPSKVSSIKYNEMDIVNISGAENENKPEIVLTRKEEDEKEISVPPLILRWVDEGLVPAEDAYYTYYKDSIKDLRESMGIYDRNFIKWYNMSEMLIRSKRSLEAIDAVDKALEIIPQHYEKYRIKLEIYKAEALIRGWEYVEGKEILDGIMLRDAQGQVDCSDDEIALVYLNLGRAYMGLRDYKIAMAMYKESYKIIESKYNEGSELFILNSYIVKKEIAELEALEVLKK